MSLYSLCTSYTIQRKTNGNSRILTNGDNDSLLLQGNSNNIDNFKGMEKFNSYESFKSIMIMTSMFIFKIN